MPFAQIQPMRPIKLLRKALLIANRAIVSDIETECPRIDIDGMTWWDTLPMLNEQEHSTEVLDMVCEALSFGLASGLLVRHPQMPQLLRIMKYDLSGAPL